MEQMKTKPWSVSGKYVLITGATSGIGLAAAKELAVRGADLGIVARSQVKANETVEQIRMLTGGKTKVDVFLADLTDQQSIRSVASEILTQCPRIDVLINNAGAMFVKRILTRDGMEKTWAINHLAPFLLTTLLLDRLKMSGQARIITTSSHGHKMAKTGIVFDDITAEKRYSFPQLLMGGANFRYGETKLANILFTTELARLLGGTGVVANCFDPGLVATNFNQDNGLLARMTMAVMKRFSRPVEKGAETLVWLADSNEISRESGKYYVDMKEATPTVAAQSEEIARKLWEVSERQTQQLKLG
ncbi:SDR family NAD(P)-dependent oxidoreductase [Paenibacillus sp. CGMCC 1.16610]|uniref:SDR family NAD(P)-dependent oxidoreductase n=1 Tax=Paenibacillus anseongense TaxID=2682845 RepID=A0ABW9UC74_9BACL|nr:MULTISPECIES: SDR family NAD(P)-dependent oxidoreductase [Paenibacillus]MBA2937548.1 SDR family NAD(P)-dependent oxidoreductase [Paenibacillus sp. CGMCC 1.16610]MVQ36606.1 SDR family NAD(P)-dependent oxidoreductase [Paenibacillus anseongense]